MQYRTNEHRHDDYFAHRVHCHSIGPTDNLPRQITSYVTSLAVLLFDLHVDVGQTARLQET